MAVVNGSLIDQIGQLRDGGTELGVLLIDEQSSFTGTPTLIETQQKLLVAAARLGCRFFLAEIHPPGVAMPAANRTLLRLRALLHAATPVVAKQRFNAFEGTNLQATMTARGVTTHLVVLGHAANCCVIQTAIGGQYKATTPLVAGATGLGYTVMTTPAVLSQGPATWTGAQNVEFYTDL